MKPLRMPELNAMVWPGLALISVGFALYGGWSVYQVITTHSELTAASVVKVKAAPNLIVNTSHTHFGEVVTSSPTPNSVSRSDPFSTQ